MDKVTQQILDSPKNLLKTINSTEKQAFDIAKGMFDRKKFNRFLRILGPGLVTGAADDDPSGIATYSQAGAGFGLGLLWAFPLMYPLLLAVQESCARIGAITGKGLAAVIKENYNKKLLYASVALVVTANIINIGADLGAMAAATQLFVDLPFALLAIAYATIIMLLVIFVDYKNYVKILKWLALALFAYPITAFLVGQDWGEVLRNTFLVKPKLDMSIVYILMGMLGTTISPYLFFWDTSDVVETEVIKHNMQKVKKSPGVTRKFLKSLRLDNFVGMTLASVTAWFIVVACASTLHASGITEINTAADAARALEPLVKGFPNAGLVAKLIFSTGIIGLGLLAVPVLAGSSSYAISEAFGWREGLHHRFKRAINFYVIILLTTFIGLLINFLGIDPIKALVFTAVFNGVAAVPLLFMIAKIGNSKKIMGDYKNGWVSNTFVRLAIVVMTGAVLVLFYSFVK
jgi:NRAMP (natural resistance-associated macrophage protein)-like metal ion transporter